MLIPAAVSWRTESMPGFVPGTLISTLGRSTAAGRSWARFTVFGVSKARSASTSIEMKPSAPPDASWAGRMTSQAAWMSWIQSGSKIWTAVASAGNAAIAAS